MSVLVSFLEKNQEWRIYPMSHAFFQAPSMVGVTLFLVRVCFDILKQDILDSVGFGLYSYIKNWQWTARSPYLGYTI